MELKRKITREIISRLHEGHKALLITGARQVGKTYSVRRALEEAGYSYVEINLIDTPAASQVLLNAGSADELVMGLSVFTEKKPVKGQTVIFIDEVQRCKEMVTRIKFLVEEGSFRYILSGSLLGVELTGLSSAPVGYLGILKMFPLDFEEFLQTANIGNELIENLRECFLERRPVMDAVNEKMLSMFTRYLMVGGMPAAVSAFADSSHMSDVMNVHSDLLSLYKLDFTQYETQDKKLLITNVYDLIPSELLKQNKRFIVSDLKKGLHFDRIESTFLWLDNAGVALPVFNATEPRMPLKLNEKHSLFKLYLSDVGLLTSVYGMETKRMLLTGDPHMNAGGIYENAVTQELYSKGFPLYYYNSNRLGELDFVIEYRNKVLPIEVKSGKDYTIHSSIDHCLNNPEYNMEEAFVFANCNVKRRGKVSYLPVYMVMFLEKEANDLVVDKIVF